MECIKFIMFTFNIIFWMCGGAMMGLGIWLAVDPAAFDALGAVESAGMDNEMWAIGVYTFIAIGALVFLLGFLGCWGACVSSTIPLWIYSVLVGVILLAEIAVVVLIAIYWGSVDDSVAQAMYTDVRNKYTDADPNDALSTSWNIMQTEWDCCGSYNYTDYKGSNFDISHTDDVWIPSSCCKDTENVETLKQCQAGTNTELIHSQGCYDALREFLDQNAPIIIGVTCGFAALQIIGLIFACCLIHKKHDHGKYV